MEVSPQGNQQDANSYQRCPDDAFVLHDQKPHVFVHEPSDGSQLQRPHDSVKYRQSAENLFDVGTKPNYKSHNCQILSSCFASLDGRTKNGRENEE
jgi:hypothetical protein